MKTKNRPKSKNIVDKRTPFGSNSLSEMSWSSRVQAHYMTSITGAASNRVEGSKLKKSRRSK